MSATLNFPNIDIAILSRMIRPERGDLSATAARGILKITFAQWDLDRMSMLSQKARDGALSADEEREITEYERVGHLLDALHSKARQSLKKQVNGR